MPLLSGPTIKAGESLSNGMDLSSNQPFLVITPFQWTSANLSFEVSTDGTTYRVMYYQGGLWQLACPPNVTIMLNVATFWPRGIHIKFRSGTPANPVNQQADRMFQVLTG